MPTGTYQEYGSHCKDGCKPRRCIYFRLDLKVRSLAMQIIKGGSAMICTAFVLADAHSFLCRTRALAINSKVPDSWGKHNEAPFVVYLVENKLRPIESTRLFWLMCSSLAKANILSIVYSTTKQSSAELEGGLAEPCRFMKCPFVAYGRTPFVIGLQSVKLIQSGDRSNSSLKRWM